MSPQQLLDPTNAPSSSSSPLSPLPQDLKPEFVQFDAQVPPPFPPHSLDCLLITVPLKLATSGTTTDGLRRLSLDHQMSKVCHFYSYHRLCGIARKRNNNSIRDNTLQPKAVRQDTRHRTMNNIYLRTA
jgi:hypothetical protein